MGCRSVFLGKKASGINHFPLHLQKIFVFSSWISYLLLACKNVLLLVLITYVMIFIVISNSSVVTLILLLRH